MSSQQERRNKRLVSQMRHTPQSEFKLVRAFIALGFAICMCACSEDSPASASDGPTGLNLLLVVADDLNWDSVGAYGCEVPDITPNIDRLASEGMRFEHAHVTVAVCQPSRHVLLTGRYPHRSGGEGFYKLRIPGVPILPGVLREAGYRVGALGKLAHSTPYADFEWDYIARRKELGMGRNPELFAKSATEFFEQSREAGKPFFLMVNSHDPHRPFFGDDPDEWYDSTAHPAVPPSTEYDPVDCAVPAFLPELAAVAVDVTSYYNSVRRFDDTLGAVLEALKASQLEDDTVVVFLSDNGMSFPFAKASCYLNSTRTPWIVRWPGRVTAGSVCSDEMISAIDLMPTLLEVAGIQDPGGMDGRSIIELLDGSSQADRDFVFTQFGQSASGDSFPTRCIQSRNHGYMFNPWSDGIRSFTRLETSASRTFLALTRASNKSRIQADRLEFLLKRTPEELYDFDKDPGAMDNRIDDPALTSTLDSLREELESWMVRFNDPALNAFRMRNSSEVVDGFVSEMDSYGGEK
ncbi:MAG: N-sulfoglucosamine sulfohydrolase [Planctomycetota bacterium]|jgi:N-sulfoglucosamine sulfohydrolase